MLAAPANPIRINRTPGVCGGDPCIRNTRITVHGLVEWRQAGRSDTEILDSIPELTSDDLQSAWEYYTSHRSEIDAILQAEQRA